MVNTERARVISVMPNVITPLSDIKIIDFCWDNIDLFQTQVLTKCFPQEFINDYKRISKENMAGLMGKLAIEQNTNRIVGGILVRERYRQYIDCDNILYIEMLAVHPDYRKLGIANSLLQEIEMLAIYKHIQYLKLHVAFSNGVGLLRYMKNGFQVDSVEKKFYVHNIGWTGSTTAICLFKLLVTPSSSSRQ